VLPGIPLGYVNIRITLLIECTESNPRRKG